MTDEEFSPDEIAAVAEADGLAINLLRGTVGWTAVLQSQPGLISQGNTAQEAIANLTDAMHYAASLP